MGKSLCLRFSGGWDWEGLVGVDVKSSVLLSWERSGNNRDGRAWI